jgi:peptidoglycan/LPS O-acetylase OafA/YrhL
VVWGFPVQQTVIHFVPDISPMSLFALAGAATFICALLSWHGVEKAALTRRKPKEGSIPEGVASIPQSARCVGVVIRW